jgi:hypothetical protein
MPIQKIQAPHIRFEVRGITYLHVNKRKQSFYAGIIKSVDSDEEIPDHIHSITVKKLVKGNPSKTLFRVNQKNPAGILSLIIGNQARSGSKQTSRPGFEFFNPKSRTFAAGKQDNDRNFDLALNLRERINKVLALQMGRRTKKIKTVSYNNNALRSVLNVSGIEQAFFSTKKKAYVHIITNFGDMGEVAHSIEALIPLPASGARLVKGTGKSRNDEEVAKLEYKKGVSYEIIVKNTCRDNCCEQSEVDHIYNDFILGTGNGEKIIFVNPRRYPCNDTTPAAGCPSITGP